MVVDKSTKEINQINRALKNLFRTANSMRNMKMSVNTTGIDRAISKTRTLQRDMSALARHQINIRPNINTRAVESALSRLVRNRSVNIMAGVSGGLGGGFGRSIGRDIAFGFRASIGNELFRMMRGVGREAVSATSSSEDARVRLLQAGFTDAEANQAVEMSRKVQQKFSQVPAAAILDASVEQLSTLRNSNASLSDYETAMERVARNSQRLAIAYKDAAKGAVEARQLERLSQIMGADVDNTRIQELQDAAMRAVVASGSEMTIAEAVRTMQQLGSTLTRSLSPQALTDILLTRDEGGRASTAEWRTAMQNMMRADLNKADKRAQTALGLRDAQGRAIPEVVDAFSSSFIDAVDKYIVPALEAPGLGQAGSAEIGAWLDEVGGFTTAGARAIADAAFSLRDGETRRQRAAARAVNLNPQLAQNTFRGATQSLIASFDTATGRNLEKLGPIFAAEVTPLTKAIDLAGQQADRGEFAKAADTMLKASGNLLLGPAGTALAGVGVLDGLRTLLDPSSSKLEKGSATLQVAASTLLGAATSFGDMLGVERPVTPEDIAARRMNEFLRELDRETERAKGFSAIGRQVDSAAMVKQTTTAAVKEFQRQQGLKPDGIIGPRTTAALNKVGTSVEKLVANQQQTAKAATDNAEIMRKYLADQRKRDEETAAAENKVKGIDPNAKGPVETARDFISDAISNVTGLTNTVLKPVFTAKDAVVTALDFLTRASNNAAEGVSRLAQATGVKDTPKESLDKAIMAAERSRRNSLGNKPFLDEMDRVFRLERLDKAFDRRDTVEGIKDESMGGIDSIITNAFNLGGQQAGDAITTAGQSLPPMGALFGDNAEAAINAPGLGSQFGRAAAAAISAAAANIRVNVNQAAGPNTGASNAPVE